MEVKIIDAEDFQRLSDQMQEIKKIITDKISQKKGELSENWLDNQNVCQSLHVSKRTLQYYRDNNTLAFTKVGNKIYYKQSDVEALLRKNYNG